MVWDRHGEVVVPNPVQSKEVVSNEIVTTNCIENMIEDAARSMLHKVEVDDDDDDVNVDEQILKKLFL